MKKATRSLFCALLAVVLTLSVAVLPAITAHADEAFDHPLSESANANDVKFVEELKEVGNPHIISFDVNDFSLPYANTFGDKIADEDDAYNGKAAVMWAESRESEDLNMLNLANSADCLPLNLVEQSNSVEGMQVLGMPSIIADGNYHLYKFDSTYAHKGGNYKFMYIFNDWGFQVTTWGTKLADWANKPVNIYLSMKVEGDLTFADSTNLPVYHIDRILVSDTCRDYDIEYTGTVEATCTENAGTSGTCPKCGNTVIQYEMGTRLSHSYTNYVTNEDGSQTAECDYGCGKTDTIAAPEPETEPVETTAPADETESADDETQAADDETTPVDDNEPADKGSNSTGLSPVVLIVFGVLIVGLIAAAVIVMVKPSKKAPAETAKNTEE